MTVTADNKKRVRLGMANPGDRFDVAVSADGIFVLRRLEPVKERPIKARLAKDGKYTVLVTNHPVDEALLKQALSDFP